MWFISQSGLKIVWEISHKIESENSYDEKFSSRDTPPVTSARSRSCLGKGSSMVFQGQFEQESCGRGRVISSPLEGPELRMYEGAFGGLVQRQTHIAMGTVCHISSMQNLSQANTPPDMAQCVTPMTCHVLVACGGFLVI